MALNDVEPRSNVDAPVPAARKRSRRRRKLIIVGALLGLVLAVGGTAAYYSFTKKSITTLPGIGEVVKVVPPRYLFSIYGVTSPLGVALSPDEQRIYVTEGRGERTIRLFDREGKPLGTMVPPETTAGQRRPYSVAVAPDGRVFVTDRIRVAVDVYSPEGAYLGPFVPAAVRDNGGWLPLGVSVDHKGNVYITDTAEEPNKILVFSPEGTLRNILGGNQSDSLSYPYGVVLDGGSRVYVSDSNNGRISILGTDGRTVSYFGSGDQKGSVGIPRGMALDRLGRLHVVDAVSHQVIVYQAGDPPSFMFSFGEPGIGDGEFRYPNGLAVDGYGRVYVTDRDNDRVQVWTY